MSHEGFIYHGERIFFAAESFPSVPIDITLKVGAENLGGAVFGDKGDCGATNGATKTEDLSFHEFGFERRFDANWSE